MIIDSCIFNIQESLKAIYCIELSSFAEVSSAEGLVLWIFGVFSPFCSFTTGMPKNMASNFVFVFIPKVSDTVLSDSRFNIQLL